MVLKNAYENAPDNCANCKCMVCNMYLLVTKKLFPFFKNNCVGKLATHFIKCDDICWKDEESHKMIPRKFSFKHRSKAKLV